MTNFIVLLILALIVNTIHCETGYEAWLRYRPVSADQKHKYSDVPEVVVITSDSPIVESCVSELSRGLNGLLSLKVKRRKSVSNESSIVLSKVDANQTVIPTKDLPKDLKPDGYHIRFVRTKDKVHIVIVANTDAGLLYGTFALLRKIALYEDINHLNVTDNPFSPLR